MTDASAALAHVLDTVGYLRVSVGDDDGDWLTCTSLVTDPDALETAVRRTAADRGIDRDDVALSLFVQGYAFRVASVAVGAWLLDDVVIDVAPHNTAIALGRGRPNAVRLDRVDAVTTSPNPDALHRTLVDAHLVPLLDNARRVRRIGRALLWSNVGAACASAFEAFAGPRPDLRSRIRDRLDAFVDAGRPDLSRSGSLVHLGPTWAWDRSACCLYYRCGAERTCEDCPLVSDDDRLARHRRIEAEQS